MSALPCTHTDGDCVVGRHEDGKPHGVSHRHAHEGKYCRKWKDDTMQGQGIYKRTHGDDKCVGEFKVKHNKLYGQCTVRGANGNEYVEEFRMRKCRSRLLSLATLRSRWKSRKHFFY
jgi:hypothetical protein